MVHIFGFKHFKVDNPFKGKVTMPRIPPVSAPSIPDIFKKPVFKVPKLPPVLKLPPEVTKPLEDATNAAANALKKLSPFVKKAISGDENVADAPLQHMDEIIAKLLKFMVKGIKIVGANVIASQTGLTVEEVNNFGRQENLLKDIAIARKILDVAKIISAVINLAALGIEDLTPIGSAINSSITLLEGVIDLAAQAIELDNAIQNNEKIEDILLKLVNMGGTIAGLAGEESEAAKKIKELTDSIDKGRELIADARQKVLDVGKQISDIRDKVKEETGKIIEITKKVEDELEKVTGLKLRISEEEKKFAEFVGLRKEQERIQEAEIQADIEGDVIQSAEIRGNDEDISDLQARVDRLEKQIQDLSTRETGLEEADVRIRKKVGLKKKRVLTEEQRTSRLEALARGRAKSKANREERKRAKDLAIQNPEDKRTTVGIGQSEAKQTLVGMSKRRREKQEKST